MKKLALGIVLITIILSTGCGSNPSPGRSSAAGIYRDGTYVGYSDADDHGYGVATVTISKDKIVAVELTEITEKGREKDYVSYPHQPVVDAVNLLAAQFVEKNAPAVDAFTGATLSSRKWEEAVARALSKAKMEKNGAGTYFTGTFQGQSELNEHNQRAIALVTIEDDNIRDVVLKQTGNYEGDFKSRDNYDYESFFTAQEEMASRFVEANSAAVDVFTGASSSSQDWMTAVKVALENAKR